MAHLTRRQMLHWTAGLAAAASPLRGWLTRPAGAAAPPSVAGAPNILYIFTDQQFAGAMSCTGNPYLKTPAADSLAASGMRFERAYCASPVCSPSRASMFTGLMPHEHGVPKNDLRIKPELQGICIEHLLATRGYECAYAGKWHLARGPILAKDEQRQHPFRVLCGAGSGKADGAVTSSCSQFLAERRERPFFLAVSYQNPHDICYWRGAPPDIIAGSVEECPPLPPNFAVPEAEARVMRQIYTTRHPEMLNHDATWWRQYLYAYYRLIEKVDAEIGRLLEALRQNGLEENTLIIFSSDHGDGAATHQWLGKCTHYEEATRVPFILSYKKAIEPGRIDRTHLLSAGPDVYATVLDYAGIEAPEGCRGASVRPLTEAAGGADTPWRDQVVSEIWVAGPNGKNIRSKDEDAFGRMLRTARYKYAIYERGANREQLFDLERDGGELHNLAADPAARTILNDHRRRLAAWCAATGDSGFAPFLIAPRVEEGAAALR